MDLDEIERKASQSQHEVTELKATVRQLVERVDRQALVIGVLKEMLLGGERRFRGRFPRPTGAGRPSEGGRQSLREVRQADESETQSLHVLRRSAPVRAGVGHARHARLHRGAHAPPLASDR
jgi:hypothetical protein